MLAMNLPNQAPPVLRGLNSRKLTNTTGVFPQNHEAWENCRQKCWGELAACEAAVAAGAFGSTLFGPWGPIITGTLGGVGCAGKSWACLRACDEKYGTMSSHLPPYPTGGATTGTGTNTIVSDLPPPPGGVWR